MKKLFLFFVVVMLSTSAFGQPYNVGILVHGGDPTITEVINHQGPTDWVASGNANTYAYTRCDRGETLFYENGFTTSYSGHSFSISDNNETQVRFYLSIGEQQPSTNFAAVTYEGE